MSKMDFDPASMKSLSTTFPAADAPMNQLPTTSSGNSRISGGGGEPGISATGTTYFTTTAKNEPPSVPEPFICGGCGKPIVDRYLLRAIDKYWHEDCLTCAACNCRLGEVGSTLFLKKDLILCKTDYLRIFGVKGRCAACGKDIPACEMVMRASNNVYHLECFGCQDCHCRFCVGERFYLDLDNNKILCEDDYKERLLFAQMATYPYGSWDQLKREISQKLEDMDEVAKVQGLRR